MINKLLFYLFFVTFTLFFTQETVSQQSILLVTINTQPEDVIIIVDGKRMERKNSIIELVKGKYHLVIESYGYYNLETDIKVSRKSAYFNFVLTEDPSVPPIPVKIVEAPKDSVVNEVFIEEQEIVVEESKEPYTLEIDMVFVKGHTFLMGKSGNNDKTSLHYVTLDNYYIGKYEVTQEQWQVVMGNNPSKFKGEQLPVENVSWEAVQEFISKLNNNSDKKYRLPTEAEWEFAARGGVKHNTREAFKYAGSNTIDDYAWYWRNSGDSILSSRWDNELIKQNHCQTKEVGQKKANSLGIYDMTGNVWEWCSDWYADDYYNISPERNPQGAKDGKTRVYRGGSYVSKIRYCPVYFRFSGSPIYGYNYLGFRLVQVP